MNSGLRLQAVWRKPVGGKEKYLLLKKIPDKMPPNVTQNFPVLLREFENKNSTHILDLRPTCFTLE